MNLNEERLIERMRRLIETPSVVGYYPEIHQVLGEMAAQFDAQVFYDRRNTAYIFLEGQNPERTIAIGAHLDTVGLIVRGVEENGWLRVRGLGGINYHSLENENVIVHTRKKGNLSGMLIHEHHSVHAFDDAREAPRSEETMKILLDEEADSKQDVYELGIHHGDLVSIEPRFVRCSSGFIKSRHIDDKACAACLLEAAHILQENGLQPYHNILLAFPINEEIGLGGSFVPRQCDTYIAMDIGLCGPDQQGSEKTVSINAADRIAPYDWQLTTALIDLAENAGLNYAVDAFYRYATDATVAISAGNNITHAAFGPGCMNTHSYERTHIEALRQTALLTIEIMLADSI